MIKRLAIRTLQFGESLFLKEATRLNKAYIKLNSGNLGHQKTDSGVFILG